MSAAMIPGWSPAPRREAIARALLGDVARRVPVDARASLWAAIVGGRAEIVATWSSGSQRMLVLGAAERRSPLTEREEEILRCLGRGLANKEIAFELGVARASVVRGVSTLAEKLGLASRLELALLAAILDPSEPAPVATHEIHVGRSRYTMVSASFGAHPAYGELSSSQREIIELLLAGCDRAELARRRGTSERTIANQLAALFRKLGVSGTTAFVTALLHGTPRVRPP